MKKAAKIKVCTLFIVGLCLIFTANFAHAQATIDYPVVKLRSLDKVTARTMTFNANVGSTLKFGSIYIKVQACRKAAEMETPEAASFIQVWEVPPGQSPQEKSAQWVFSGWMFSSSPGLSSMDHPIYDVWVLDCLQTKDEAALEERPEDEAREGEGEVSGEDAPSQPDAADIEGSTDQESEQQNGDEQSDSAAPEQSGRPDSTFF